MDDVLLATWVECGILGPAWISYADQILGSPGCKDNTVEV